MEYLSSSFETYNAQRQANIESRSLNLFSTIIDELNVAKEYLYSIEYESNNGLVQGKNAVLFFKHSLHNISPGLNGMPEVAIESRKIWSNCTGYDRYIIKHILEFLKKIIFVAEKVQSSELIQVHTLSCKWHMLNLMEEYFNSYDEIPQLIVDSLQGASSNKDDYSFYAAHDVNYFVQQIIDYFSCIHRLQELSVVELNNAETVSIDEYFAKPDIDIELIKGFFGQRRKVKKG